MKSLFYIFFFMPALFFITTPSIADDFWDLPTAQTKAQKTESPSESNNDIWALDSPDKQTKAMSDKDFWAGGGNTSLDDYIQKREEIRLAEEAKAKAAAEAKRIAQLEQQRESEAQKAEEARIRQAQNDARRRQEQSQKSDNGMFGKMLAIGMGAVIADSSSLNSAAKADFMTNYSTDVLNNDMSMSNTKQWKNNTVQTSNQSNNSSGGASEEERNRRISSRCKQKSKSYNDGNGQSTPHCQLAIYNQCIADKMCSLYPSKCMALRSRVTTSCDMLSTMRDTLCPACR